MVCRVPLAIFFGLNLPPLKLDEKWDRCEAVRGIRTADGKSETWDRREANA